MLAQKEKKAIAVYLKTTKKADLIYKQANKLPKKKWKKAKALTNKAHAIYDNALDLLNAASKQ